VKFLRKQDVVKSLDVFVNGCILMWLMDSYLTSLIFYFCGYIGTQFMWHSLNHTQDKEVFLSLVRHCGTLTMTQFCTHLKTFLFRWAYCTSWQL